MRALPRWLLPIFGLLAAVALLAAGVYLGLNTGGEARGRSFVILGDVSGRRCVPREHCPVVTGRPTPTTTTAPLTTTTPPPLPPPSPVPDRGVFAVGYDAWRGSDASVLGRLLGLAVFHAPEPGPDEDARKLFVAAGGKSYAYQEWGFSCNQETWTTCAFSTTAARAAGFTARYNGNEAWPADFDITSVDQGKAGYGKAWAERVALKLQAATPRYTGVMLDDVNIFDARLPNYGRPDGYADNATYAAAVTAQLEAARDYLHAAGYRLMGNFGGITEGRPESLAADTLVGILDYTVVENCGIWPDGSAQGKPEWRRIIAAAQRAAATGSALVCNGNATSEDRARYNDYLTRIITDPGHGAGFAFGTGGVVAPWSWYAFMGEDHGLPAEPMQRSGSHLWRRFADGETLNVDLANVSAWVTA